jgi:hypothetical protein
LFSKNPAQGLERKNTNTPIYTPSAMFMRDDELYNSSVGAFFDAPSWSHEDYYAFMLFERILGNYQCDRNGVAHLNTVEKQYSTFEFHLGALPDVHKGVGTYSPYRDCGLFGSFFQGNEVFTKQMAYTGLSIPPTWGVYVRA